MEKTAKIYVAGHRGLVGSALMKNLHEKGYGNLIVRTSKELDLRIQRDVDCFFKEEGPEYVFLAAAKVGGIMANATSPGTFIYENIIIQTNVIEAARKYGVKKLLFLGSTCIYPRLAPQPLKEEYLLTGELEKTNDAYAIAKIAGIKMCSSYNRQYETNFLSVMPTNLYGPNDNYDLETSHVLPALIRKIHEAKLNHKPYVDIWGTGSPLREFLYVDDMAEACVFLMEKHNFADIGEFVNVGTGVEISISALAETICRIVEYKGSLKFDVSKPNGTPRKVSDVSKLTQLGWQSNVSLEEGIRKTYNWFLKHHMK